MLRYIAKRFSAGKTGRHDVFFHGAGFPEPFFDHGDSHIVVFRKTMVEVPYRIVMERDEDVYCFPEGSHSPGGNADCCGIQSPPYPRHVFLGGQKRDTRRSSKDASGALLWFGYPARLHRQGRDDVAHLHFSWLYPLSEKTGASLEKARKIIVVDNYQI